MNKSLTGCFVDEYDEELYKDNDNPDIPQKQTLDNVEVIPRDLDTLSSDQSNLAAQRFKLLSRIAKELKGGWTPKNLEPLIEKHHKGLDLKKPSSRTVARWWQRYISSGGDVFSLANRHYDKGNRKIKCSEYEEIYEEALARFLNAKRPSIQNAYNYYFDKVTLLNKGNKDIAKEPLSYSGFRNRIKNLPPYTLAVARHGKQLADIWFGYFGTHTPPTRVLERVEIDHTPLDLILLDDELFVPLGRPNLTLLLDVYSGVIIGFHLSYHSPCYATVAKALIHSMSSKDYVQDKYPSIKNRWLCEGKIETLVVDNGKEFWSDSLDHACNSIKVAIQFCRSKKPWLKPFIEREFGSINSMLLDIVPGKTFSNLLERENYNPEKDAIVRFSTFVEEFHRWIIDVHNVKPNSRKTRIPNELWSKSVEDLPPLELKPSEIKQLQVAMGIKANPTLTDRGVTINYLRYDSLILVEYRKRYPQKKDARKKIVKIDPDDVSSIYIYLEELGGYIQVPCEDPVGYTQGLSLHQHKVFVRYTRNYISKEVDIEALAQARLEIINRLEEEQKLVSKRTSKTTKPLKSRHKQAEFQGVSSTTKGTIKVEPSQIVEEEDKPNNKCVESILDDWDSMISELD